MLPLSTITQSFCGEKIELESLDENKPIEIDSVCCWNKLVERGLGVEKMINLSLNICKCVCALKKRWTLAYNTQIRVWKQKKNKEFNVAVCHIEGCMND